MTNGDKIRQMSDDELAEYFALDCNCPPEEKLTDCNSKCYECWLKWLKSEGEE